MEKYCHVALDIDLTNGDAPGSLTVTAIVGGKKIDASWRGGSASTNSSNLADVAHDLYTADEWKTKSATLLDDGSGGSWETFANWCDEVMADGSARWSFNGLIYQRDPEAALTEVLLHAQASTFQDTDGSIKIWAEQPPPSLADTWSTSGSSTTLTADTSTGDATTRLSAGDQFWAGTNLAEVDSVTSDDEIEMVNAIDVTAVYCRVPKQIRIRTENWVTVPEGTDLDTATIPEVVVVRYLEGSGEYGSQQWPRAGDVALDVDRKHEITLSGCNNASMARRYSETSQQIIELQPFTWSGVADGIAVDLEPGDVCFIDDDILDNQPVRIMPPIEWTKDGKYVLQMREFDIGAYSDNTQADDTPPSHNPPWSTTDPDGPVSCTQTFGETGDWDESSYAPPDPDNLNTLGYFSANMGISYNASEDASELYLNTGSATGYLATEFVPDGTTEQVCFSLCVALKEDANDDTTWRLVYKHGASYAAAVEVDGVSMDPPSNLEYIRIHEIFTLDTTPGTNHYFFIEPTHAGAAPGAGSEETLYVKRVRNIPWENDPEFSLWERWSWVEHVDAPDTVLDYRLMWVRPDGRKISIMSVPQGAASLEYTVIIGGQAGALGGNGPLPGYFNLDMETRGLNGKKTDFPSPTQYFNTRQFLGRVERQKDVDVSGRINGDILVYNSSTEKYESADHGTIGGLGDDDHPHYLLRSDWAENGFVDRDDSTLAWVDGTRTLTLSPAVDDFDYFYDGIRYTEDGDLSATITDTEGLWLFYIGSGGAASLSTIHNPSYEQVEDAIDNECLVAYVYWDATNNDGRLLNERHGYVMNRGVHHYLHELFGSQYRDGMTLGDIAADESGNSDSHAQFSITAGKFYDEDIGHSTLAHASTDTWECYYVDGSGNVRWVTCEATFPVYAIGTPATIAYNNGGTLTAVANNKYICYHVFATNIHTDAGGDYYPVVTPGTAEYGSKAEAQDAALTEIQGIDFGDWPKEEVIPIATVIYKHSASMGNGVEAAIQTTEGGGDFIDWRYTAVSGSSTSVNDHGAMSGLFDDDHPQYFLVDGTRVMTGDIDTDGNDVIFADGQIVWDAGARIAIEGSPGSGVYGGLIGTVDNGADGDLYIGQSTGGYYRTVLYSGDYIELADDSRFGDISGGDYTELESSRGNINQFGDSLIDTENTISADEGLLARAWFGNNTKAMANGVSQNFWKWGTGAAAGEAMGYTIDFTIQVEHTVLGTTFYWTRSGSLAGQILFNGTNCYGTSSTGVVWNGAALCRNAAGGTSTPSMNETVAQGAGGGVATLGPYFQVNLASGFVSAYCTYCVKFTGDVDPSYITVW